MKIVMIFDQIQSGLGTKDDTMVPLTGKKEPVGPAVMMQPFLKDIDGHCTMEVASQEWMDNYMKTRMAPVEE